MGGFQSIHCNKTPLNFLHVPCTWTVYIMTYTCSFKPAFSNKKSLLLIVVGGRKCNDLVTNIYIHYIFRVFPPSEDFPIQYFETGKNQIKKRL